VEAIRERNKMKAEFIAMKPDGRNAPVARNLLMNTIERVKDTAVRTFNPKLKYPFRQKIDDRIAIDPAPAPAIKLVVEPACRYPATPPIITNKPYIIDMFWAR
jgi:hypothetical protein